MAGKGTGDEEQPVTAGRPEAPPARDPYAAFLGRDFFKDAASTKNPITPNRQKILPQSARRLDRRLVETTEDGNDDITCMWDLASPGVKRNLERM